VHKAVAALHAHLARGKSSKTDLLSAGTAVQLIVRLFRVPGREKPKPVRMCVVAQRIAACAVAACSGGSGAAVPPRPAPPPLPPSPSPLFSFHPLS
jgi:hypothetical protein